MHRANKAELERLILEQYTMKQIAEMLGISVSEVTRRKQRYGIRSVNKPSVNKPKQRAVLTLLEVRKKLMERLEKQQTARKE